MRRVHCPVNFETTFRKRVSRVAPTGIRELLNDVTAITWPQKLAMYDATF